VKTDCFCPSFLPLSQSLFCVKNVLAQSHKTHTFWCFFCFGQKKILFLPFFFKELFCRKEPNRCSERSGMFEYFFLFSCKIFKNKKRKILTNSTNTSLLKSLPRKIRGSNKQFNWQAQNIWQL
jgi:hypothetical protein